VLNEKKLCIFVAWYQSCQIMTDVGQLFSAYRYRHTFDWWCDPGNCAGSSKN